MSLTYEKLKRRKKVFLRLAGVEISDFEKIRNEVKQEWDKRIESEKKVSGRPSNILTFEDKLLCLLVYYRTYITHEFLGHLFNVHNCNICRLINKLESVMVKKIHIKRDPSLTNEVIAKLIVDITEQPIQRPKKKKNLGKRTPKNKQKLYYSGKKKAHTIKKEISMTGAGKIVALSKSVPGKRHDYRIRKEGKPLHRAETIYVDSGYQGLQKVRPSVKLPFKGRKKNPLTKEQKLYNTKIAKERIKVEHKIREIKVFKIMKDKYRNFGLKHNLRSNIVAGIVNMKNGFY